MINILSYESHETNVLQSINENLNKKDQIDCSVSWPFTYVELFWKFESFYRWSQQDCIFHLIFWAMLRVITDQFVEFITK